MLRAGKLNFAMSTENVKSNVVSFRLSDVEYDAVEAVSRLHGFASVSVFARSATVTCNSSEAIHRALTVDINRLWHRLEALTTAFEDTAAQLGIALTRTTSQKSSVLEP